MNVPSWAALAASEAASAPKTHDAETRYWNRVGEAWTIGAPLDRLWREHSDAVNGALLERWLPERAGLVLKTDLFDEAVGSGLMGGLERRGRAFGIDTSIAIARSAVERSELRRAACADVRQLPFGDAGFDAAVSNSTLDHFGSFEELALSLRELQRVLRPGGVLLLTLDNPVNPLVALRNALPFPLLNRVGLVPYYVGVTCGPRRLRRLLEAVGFQVSAMDAVLHCPRVLAVALCRAVERSDSAWARRVTLRLLGACEALSGWPLRYLTGHFVAVRAIKK
jgi:SAM-dependent methyltransferase